MTRLAVCKSDWPTGIKRLPSSWPVLSPDWTLLSFSKQLSVILVWNLIQWYQHYLVLMVGLSTFVLLSGLAVTVSSSFILMAHWLNGCSSGPHRMLASYIKAFSERMTQQFHFSIKKIIMHSVRSNVVNCWQKLFQNTDPSLPWHVTQKIPGRSYESKRKPNIHIIFSVSHYKWRG